MFINRKTRKLSRNNTFTASEDFSQNSRHQQIHISSYPILEYLFGSFLFGLSTFLIYSASGGENGIKGFNNTYWWQYFVAILPMIFGIGFIMACQIESISMNRKNNWIITTKTRFFCFMNEQVKKEFSDLIGISVVKTGKESITNYQIVLSFKTCDELHVLRCISQAKIIEYFEEVRRVFSEDEVSQKRVIIQNLLT